MPKRIKNSVTRKHRAYKSNSSQVFNAVTGNYFLRDTVTGKFIEVKSDGQPFKGVRLEKINVITNPNISRSTASKAEKAIVQYNLKHKTAAGK